MGISNRYVDHCWICADGGFPSLQASPHKL